MEVSTAAQFKNTTPTSAPVSPVYAFTPVWSPEQREIKPGLNLIGGEACIWLNGKLTFASTGDELKDSLSAAVFDREAGLALRRGWNALLVEIQQVRPRFLEPPMTIYTKTGESVRDLIFNGSGVASN